MADCQTSVALMDVRRVGVDIPIFLKRLNRPGQLDEHQLVFAMDTLFFAFILKTIDGEWPINPTLPSHFDLRCLVRLFEPNLSVSIRILLEFSELNITARK